MRILIKIFALLLVAVAAVAAPPYNGSTRSFNDYLGGATTGASLGLIDPSRVTFDHSLQLGVAGFGGSSLMQSLYSSTAHYRFSDPVTLSFTLGMVGTRFNGPGVPTMTSDLIGGVSLDYRPTTNMHFRVEVARSPGYYGLNRYAGTNSFFGESFRARSESEIPR